MPVVMAIERIVMHGSALAALGLMLAGGLTACSPAPSPVRAANEAVTAGRPGSNAQSAPPGFGSNAAQPVQMAPPSAPPSSVPRMEIGELRQRLASGDQSIFLVDARLPDEYAAGRIPTARNYPSHEISRQLETVPRDREIVVYCYGKGCGIARNVAAGLLAAGFPNVKDLYGGVTDWVEAGGAVEK